MCGLTGLVSDQQSPQRERIAAMTMALGHRGPDADGLWTDGVCALGHRRLAIIDLSPNFRTKFEGSYSCKITINH